MTASYRKKAEKAQDAQTTGFHPKVGAGLGAVVSSRRLETEIGIVCGRCESYATLGIVTCTSCGNELALGVARVPASSADPVSSKATATRGTADFSDAPAPTKPTVSFVATEASNGATAAPSTGIGGSGGMSALRSALTQEGNETPSPMSARSGGKSKQQSQKSIEELMDQAKNFVCRSCSTAVPLGHKYCGRCGAVVPPEIMSVRTQYFGQLQTPGKAKLILIRGEGVEGLSYQLNAEQHIVGRDGQLQFLDDPFVSPRHANFFYRDNILTVRDEGSTNGVYVRVRGTLDISSDDQFLAGEQVFRFNEPPNANDQPAPDGTFFYSSPKQQAHFRVTQLLQGGPDGMIVCARQPTLQIGREGGDLNFPTDLYMSGAHCKIEGTAGAFTLTDLGSRNGTYIRLKAERELGHGDYLFIGRKLLRVEITAA